MLIAPSILSADFARLGEEVQKLDAAGADYIHVDVMDGHFVPNLTIGLPVVAALRRITTKPLDVHLMIEKPGDYVERYAEAGADIISVHVEACTHLHRVLSQIRAAGKKAAVAINPATPIESIAHVMDQLDMVLLMSVNPGFGGQSFVPVVLDKIKALRHRIDESGFSIDIEVDGGIKVDNVGAVVGAGANVIVAGSGILKADDYGKRIAEFRAQIPN